MVDFADRWLPVTRLELTVFTDNERAIALYRGLGFEVEGTHRDYALRNGRYADVLAMARLKPKAGPA
jgi:putative acetyltransferase